MKRRTPLRRSKGRERGSPIPAFRAWLRGQGCAIDGYRASACHLPRVKQHGDARNMIPLCHEHHMEQHAVGVQTFADSYGLHLTQLADDYWDAFIAETGYREQP